MADEGQKKQESKSDFAAAEEIRGILLGRKAEEQARIIRWVSESLSLQPIQSSSAVESHAGTIMPSQLPAVHDGAASPAHSVVSRPKDIKGFVQEKHPKSDVQFATVVAYYYRFEASENHRKESITTKDLEEATRHVNWDRFPRVDIPLSNAVKQGYLDRVGKGAFRINAVGENLVAMSLPGTKTDSNSQRTTKRKSQGKIVRNKKPKAS